MLLSSYPLVPSALFLSVLWHRTIVKLPVDEEDDSNGESENQETVKEPRNLELLVHWAKLAPALEGGIEAPCQFLLQVNKVFTLVKGVLG